MSAIVSTYASAQFLLGCIEDLEQQTIADQLEIIVIDSASPQNEGEIVRELQGRYNNIRYLRTEQRETVYAAWNRGIAMARGRYLTNANTDDRHRPDAFELMARTLDELPDVDLVYADVIITKTPHETWSAHTPAGVYEWHHWDRNALLDTGCFIGPQPMWRRSVHELYGGFDASYVTSGDYEFWLRISQTSRFQHIAQPLGLYLARPDSIEHANELLKQQENDRLRQCYRAAASQGRLVGLLPLQRLQARMQVGASVPAGDTMVQALHEFNQVLSGLVPDYEKRSEPLRALRQAVLEQQPSWQQQCARYLEEAQRLVLQAQEWFVLRSKEKKEGCMVGSSQLQTTVCKARIQAQRGEVDQAVTLLLNHGIRVAPADPVSYQVLAELLIDAGRYEDALEVLPEMPPDTDPGLKLELEAVCRCAIGDDVAARQAAEQVAFRQRAQVVLGTLAARQGDLAGAEELFRQAVSIDSASAGGWLALGMLLWGQGRQLDAWRALRQGLAAGPSQREALQIALDMAERLGYQPELSQLLGELVVRWPDSRALARSHALLLARLGPADQALAACEAFLACFDIDDELLEAGVYLRSRMGQYDRCTAAGNAAISLCMIVKNEEKNLARCLASAKPAVHELVVVDTGSTDRTVAIATAFGARVVSFPWNGSFADARNHALEQARGAWILALDADEALSAQDHGAIAAAVKAATDRACAYSVLTRNYTTMIHAQGWTANDGSYPLEERAEGWQPSTKVRLFPNGSRFRFRGDVHEMVEPSLREAGIPLQAAPFVVHHYGELEQDPVKQLDKKQRYFEIGMQKLAQQPDDMAAICELAVQAGELGRFAEAIDLWDRVLRRDPEYVEALFNKGYCLMGLQRYDEALVCSRKVMELNPDHKEAALNYGVCELYAGCPQKALDRILPVVKRHREYPLLQALCCVLYACLGQQKEAASLYKVLREQGYAVDNYLQQRAQSLKTQGHHLLVEQLNQVVGQIRAE